MSKRQFVERSFCTGPDRSRTAWHNRGLDGSEATGGNVDHRTETSRDLPQRAGEGFMRPVMFGFASQSRAINKSFGLSMMFVISSEKKSV